MNAIRRERSVSGKVVGAGEGERPGQHTAQVDSHLVCEVERALHHRYLVGAVGRRIAIVEVAHDARRARGAAIGIRFADEDWRARKRRRFHRVEAGAMKRELLAEVQLHVPVHPRHAAFGVERDEVEAGAASPRDGVLAAVAMLQEIREKRAPRGGNGRAAQGSVGQHGVERGLRVVIQPVIFGGGSTPVTDVRLVPELPQPIVLRRSLRVAIAGMLGPNSDELGPLLVVGRRIERAAVERVRARGLVRLRLRGERAWHEAQLEERGNARLHLGVHDRVDAREVVDGSAVRVLAVEIRGAPLEPSCVVARVEQEVRPHSHLRLVRSRQRTEQLAPFLRRRGVDLVVAEIGPNWLKRLALHGGVYVDHHRSCGVGEERPAKQ